jgi:hypothetical protein
MVTKLEILQYLSNLNSLKFNLMALNNGALKDWEKEELYKHIADVLTEKGVTVTKEYVKEKLSVLDGTNLLTSFERSDILSVLNSKL